MKKRFKHKWWRHLFVKYKVIETKNSYREYARLRHLFSILLVLICIIFSPIIVVIECIKGFKDIFFFQDGKNGRNEEFVSYPKEMCDDEQQISNCIK